MKERGEPAEVTAGPVEAVQHTAENPGNSRGG